MNKVFIHFNRTILSMDVIDLLSKIFTINSSTLNMSQTQVWCQGSDGKGGIVFEISPLVSFNYVKLTMPFHFLTFKCDIKSWNFSNINYSLSSVISTYHCRLKHPSKTDIHAH